MKIRFFNKFVLAMFLLVAGAACTPKADKSRQISQDFFVSAAPEDFQRPAVVKANGKVDRSACEESLSRALCETDSTSGQISANWSRIPCSPKSTDFLPILMRIYDETPDMMRVSLCSLDRIFLSNQIPSTAFASSIVDSNGVMVGGYVGFRKESFLKQPSSLALMTWKEQLAFGGSSQFLSNDPTLVQMNYNLKMEALDADGLFYVLMHELGHLIDFNNGINMGSRQVSNRPSSMAWKNLSWLSDASPLAEAKFLMQDQFCFYNCEKALDIANAIEIYSSLSKSGFVTSYSGTNPIEDFAEFWAWHLALKYKNAEFIAEVPGSGKIDLTHSWPQNQLIQKKLAFIDQLWNSSTLKVDNHEKH
jgi:hypothetical protein